MGKEGCYVYPNQEQTDHSRNGDKCQPKQVKGTVLKGPFLPPQIETGGQNTEEEAIQLHRSWCGAGTGRSRVSIGQQPSATRFFKWFLKILLQITTVTCSLYFFCLFNYSFDMLREKVLETLVSTCPHMQHQTGNIFEGSTLGGYHKETRFPKVMSYEGDKGHRACVEEEEDHGNIQIF